MTDYSHLMDIIRQENEFVLPGEKRLELKKGGRAWRKRERHRKLKSDETIERALNRKLAQGRYYEKNKPELNRKRALRNAQPEYVYYKAMDRAKRNDIQWEFDFDSWTDMWLEAPEVLNASSGFYVTAWSMKGSFVDRCTQMHREDMDGPWSTENCFIAFEGEAIQAEQERFNNEE